MLEPAPNAPILRQAPKHIEVVPDPPEEHLLRLKLEVGIDSAILAAVIVLQLVADVVVYPDQLLLGRPRLAVEVVDSTKVLGQSLDHRYMALRRGHLAQN